MSQVFQRFDQKWAREFAGAMASAQPLLHGDLGDGAAENGKSSTELRKRAPFALGV
jgi:hypothetical protein